MTFGIALVPLIYQQTIVGTVPFWSAIFGWLLIGEVMGSWSKVALVFSFVGVILIACSSYIVPADGDQITAGDAEESTTGSGKIIGCVLILCNAVAQGVVNVTTRIMQKMHWSVILFYYSILALFSVGLMYLVTAGKAGEISRIVSYNGEQLLWIFITASLNMVSLIAKTISN